MRVRGLMSTWRLEARLNLAVWSPAVHPSSDRKLARGRRALRTVRTRSLAFDVLRAAAART